MEHLIFIREAITGSEIARFFEKLHSYHRRDIFPEIEQAEDLAYFLSDEYLSQLKTLHRRQENRLHFLFFERGGQDIGFTMPVISLGRANAGQATLSSTATPRRASASGADLAFCRTAATSGAYH